MIEGLKPYAEYKDSGQKWLGKVPAHWDIRRAKLLLHEIDSRSLTGKEQLLRVSQYTGVTQRKAADGSDSPDTRAASLIGYKRVSVNDLVINIMLAWNGSLGASRFDGITSPAYCVYRFNKGALPWYYHKLFRLPLYKGRIKTASTGVVESRLRLYSDDLGRIEALVLPPDEQAAIVRFLDHANRKIDGFIRAKRKLIGLLNEQKQAIIHRAVTRGLNPDVPLKPSGIPWLGSIPAHWQTITVGAVTSLIQTGPFGSQLHSHEYVRGGIPIVNPSHMLDGRIIPDADVAVSELKSKELARHRLAIGDIVVARRGELGRCALVTNQEVSWLCGTGSLLLRCKGDVFNPGYFQEVFSSRGVCDLLRLSSVGATMDNLNAGIVARLRFPLPTVEEQTEILQFINRERLKNEAAHSITEREIVLMQEYRTRLTADIVTGKFDVREAAAHLPELPIDPAATLDEPDLLEETEPEES